MMLDRSQATFGRHETFPLRYAWLTKGLAALQARPDILGEPEQAMVKLGIGRNMVNAIRYWLDVTGVAEFDGGKGTISDLEAVLLGPRGDRYLENEATLWILHWLIASNAEPRSTLKSDCSTLLRMYTPSAGRSEDHLDSPLAHLRLLESEDGHGYRSLRTPRPFLPPVRCLRRYSHGSSARSDRAGPESPGVCRRRRFADRDRLEMKCGGQEF